MEKKNKDKKKQLTDKELNERIETLLSKKKTYEITEKDFDKSVESIIKSSGQTVLITEDQIIYVEPPLLNSL